MSFYDGFMRPMEYMPEMAMVKTPEQSLLDELGFSESDGITKEKTSSESDSGEPMCHTTPSSTYSRSSKNEIKDLKQMLRETQRKLRNAQSNLVESKHNRERSLKIIQKTHQSAIALKQALIQELQDIICEKDECIEKLEERHKHGNSFTSPQKCSKSGPFRRLIEEISKLHKVNACLQMKYEQTADELQQLKATKEHLQDDLVLTRDTPSKLFCKPLNAHLAGQVQELQHKIFCLEREKTSSSDLEKKLSLQIAKLESQQLQLRKQLEENEGKLQEERLHHRQHQQSLKEEHSRDVSALHKKLSYKQQEIAKLESQQLQLEKQLEENEGKLQEERLQHRQDQQSLKEEHSRDISALHKELSYKQQELVNVQQQLLQKCEDLQSQLAESKTDYSFAVKAAEEKGKAMATGLSRLSGLQDSLIQAHGCVTSTRVTLTELRDLTTLFGKNIFQEVALVSRKICQRISHISNQNKSLVSKYCREMSLRKKLHNQLVELRGNIRVFCRVRPPISEDGNGSNTTIVVHPDRDDDGLLYVHRGNRKVFEMDKVFGSDSKQEEVFEEVKSLVTSCTDGYKVCIFAYGQTGSGKTFTMEGPSHNPGINQRALSELFKVVEERQEDWDYSIVVSVLEIYNESVHDLLSVNNAEKLEIKQGPDGIFVPGLIQVQVSSFHDVNEVFALGNQNRTTGATKMNIHSSRSHALLCVTVMGISRTTGLKAIGKLNLIDLAGSERVAKSGSEGARLVEAKHINKSLSALGDVIHSLRTKSQHIPYRNSKLTYLLQDCLSGDSKTLMVVHVAPVEKNISETICSLMFAQRVRAVELGQASKRVLDPCVEK